MNKIMTIYTKKEIIDKLKIVPNASRASEWTSIENSTITHLIKRGNMTNRIYFILNFWMNGVEIPEEFKKKRE